MTLKEAKKRIEQLEAEVEKLKSARPQEFHYHYHYQQPWYQPLYQPLQPVSVPTIWGVGTNGGQMTTTSTTFRPGDDVAWTYTGQGN